MHSRDVPSLMASGLMGEADAAYRAGRYAQALATCSRILAAEPGFLPARVLTAVLHLRMGRQDEAEREFQSILRDVPDHRPSLLWLGTVYARTGRFSEAVEVSTRLVSLEPDHLDGQMLLARALFELGRIDAAERELRRAIELDPDSAEAHALLGTALQQLGKLDESETELRRAIQLDPLYGPPYYDLVLCRRFQPQDLPLLESFKETIRAGGLKKRDEARIEYALGKAYDDLADYEEAARHFDRANELEFEFFSKARPPFEPSKLADDFRRARKAAENSKGTRAGSRSGLPILIVGMMRSGTTLVEQILSSHSQIGAAGEQGFWLNHIGKFLSGQRAPSEEEAKGLASEYLAILQGLSPDTARVTDKQPHNFMALGIVGSVLPNAKIIHCRRNLVDTSLSIYMTPFRVGPEFGYSKDNIVFFAKQYREIMSYWKSTLPRDRFHEVRYEELVENQERVVRGMLDFLELPWQDACLHHEANRRSVSTPSLWQVRQPIYRTSLARWRRYEPWLGPFAELIEEEG